MSDYNADADPDTDRIRQIAFTDGIAPLDNLKVDQFSTDSDNKVYSLVKRIGSTRVQVLVNPDEVPN